MPHRPTTGTHHGAWRTHIAIWICIVLICAIASGSGYSFSLSLRAGLQFKPYEPAITRKEH
jgi:hypothetical protein